MSDDFDIWLDGRMPVHGSSGDEILSDCPWCGRPKLYINRVKALFFCQRCRERGRGPKLVAKVEGVSFEEAKRKIKGQPGDASSLLGGLISSARPTPDQPDPVHHPLPPEFVPCFNGVQWQVPNYVEDPMPEGRELSDDALIRHGIGFCLNGRYRDRVVIPIIQGGQKTFLARLMGRPSDFAWRGSAGGIVEPPKYLAPRNSGLATMVYWLDRVPEGAHLVVVEGAFDAIRLIGLGIHAVATFGKHLSKTQRNLIRAKRPSRVTFLRDSDATGDAWSEAIAFRRSGSAHEMIIDVATCPHGTDPDELGVRGKGAVTEIIERAEDATDSTGSLLAALKALKK